MIWYTVRTKQGTERFITREHAEEFAQAYKELNENEEVLIVERRSRQDTTKPETYT